MWLHELIQRKDFTDILFWTLLAAIIISAVFFNGVEKIIKARGNSRAKQILAEKGINGNYETPFCRSHSEHLDRVEDEQELYLDEDGEPCRHDEQLVADTAEAETVPINVSQPDAQVEAVQRTA
jgi:hypothetical protein